LAVEQGVLPRSKPVFRDLTRLNTVRDADGWIVRLALGERGTVPAKFPVHRAEVWEIQVLQS